MLNTLQYQKETYSDLLEIKLLLLQDFDKTQT